jgi:glycosyltransferase involved in cell wall biosynthesis
VKTNQVIKVGFWFDAPLGYSGGINYLNNLLYALSLVNDGTVKPYIFFTHEVPEGTERQFSKYATVVRTKILSRWTLQWFVHKVLYKVFNSMARVNALLKRHGISVVSHVWFVFKGQPPFKIIAWIPDFQYLHLPELFPNLDPNVETRVNQQIIAQCDLAILSSNGVLEDFKRIALPGHETRGRVLRFVSQPSASVSKGDLTSTMLEKRYGYQGRYFILPNQFWAHKNHLVVLEAVARLKQDGIEIQVLCTGNTKDFRLGGTPYIDKLRTFIDTNALHGNVKILGLIDYSDVMFLLRNAVAVINPSRFEGWSSSVEEAKSAGKPVILSRIDVHVEQNPAYGFYFDPDDSACLARILAQVWSSEETVLRVETEATAHLALRDRTVEFGSAYLALIKDLTSGGERAGRD